MVGVVMFAYLLGTWALGWVMDKTKWIEALAREHNRRNPSLRTLQEEADRR